jgi:hypothetical protein
MHIRYPRASVAEGPQQQPSPLPAAVRPPAEPPQTLWATRPLVVKAGRLVAVRRRGGLLEVGLVRPGQVAIVWKPADSVVTPEEAARWMRQSQFRADQSGKR